LAPSFSAPSVAPSGAAAAAPSAPRAAAPALAASRAAADGPTPLQEPLQPGERWHGGDPRLGTGDEMVHDGPRGRELVPLSSFENSVEPVGWRSSRAKLDKTFDGATGRKDLNDAAPVAGADGSGAAPLARASASAPRAAAAVPAAPASRARRVIPFAVKAAVAVALLLMVPSVAMAATTAAVGTFSVASTLEIMAAIRPAAAAVGAIAGAVYGMIAARSQDGSETSSGAALSSVLRYGALGGAAVYMLLDVTSLAFIGPTAAGGLQPLSSAVVTAALGRTAFQGKFMDPKTTAADRIIGAFPAVAAALGISLGVVGLGFAATPLAVTAALGAMTVTGVTTALYTALFKLGRSPLDGPDKMGKGFVLQALMLGMALAVTNPYLFWFFAAMGAAGFGLTLWTMGKELLSFLPGRAVPAPAPAPAPAPPIGTPPGKI
jgi:hypothetical protein